MTSHSRALQWTLFGTIAVLLLGCGSAAGGGNPPPVTAPAVLALTSVSALGTSTEPSTVAAEATTAGMTPVVIADSDADPLGWSITASTPAGDTVLVITARDAAGNVRTFTTQVSVP